MNLLNEIYKQIPKFECIEGCHDCCGPTIFSKTEWDAIEDKRMATDITCPYASDKGCDIYNQRPLICRMFGAVDDPRLKCPHGCRPKKLMKKKKAHEIINQYHGMIDL